MTKFKLRQAAKELHTKYMDFCHPLECWLQSIGITDDEIIMYVRHENFDFKKAKEVIGDEYKGFKVKFHYIGNIVAGSISS